MKIEDVVELGRLNLGAGKQSPQFGSPSALLVDRLLCHRKGAEETEVAEVVLES